MQYSYYKRYIFIIFCIYFIWTPILWAEGIEAREARVVGNIREPRSPWYAVIRIDTSKKKLYTKGDILYTRGNIDNCLRIEDIKEDTLVLKDTDSKDVVVVRRGCIIPIEEREMIFEKVVKRDVIEYRYKPGKIEKELEEAFK